MTQPDDLLDAQIPVTPEPPVAPRDGRSLSERAASGFLIQGAGIIAAKFINLASLITITYYIAPESFKVAGVAITWTAYLSAFVQSGLPDLGVSNAPRYDRLERSLNFVAVVLAIGGLILAFASIPLLLLFIPGNSAWLLMIGFSTSAIVGLRSVFQSKQNLAMQFRLLTTIGLVAIVVNSSTTVAMAMLGAGPYAMVLPPLLAAIAAMFWLLRRSPPRIRWRGFRRLAPLYLNRSSPFFFAAFLTMVWATADFLIVPYFDTDANTAFYIQAYNLSQQLAIVLGANVASTLFASLASLVNQRVRLQHALLRSLTIFWVATLCFTMVQLTFAAPAFRFVFNQRYHPGIPLLQIFTVASAAYMTGTMIVSTLRLVITPKRYLLQLFEFAVVFLIVITLGAMAKGAMGACLATVGWGTYFMLRSTSIALRETPQRGRLMARNLSLPLIAIAPAAIVQVGLWLLVPQSRAFEWVQAFIVCGVLLGTYPMLIRKLMPTTYQEVRTLTLGLVRRIFGKFIKV